MLRLISCLCAFFLFSLPVHAEKSAEILLKETAADALAFADARYAFTVDHWAEQNGETVSLKLRFDPRRPDGDAWSLVDKTLEDLTKPEKKAFKQFRKSENADDMLVYDKLGEGIDNATLVEETDARAIFSAPVIEEDLPEDVLEMVATLNKELGFVSKLEVRTLKPFKPAAVAKIKSMSQIQTYAPPQENSPALLQTSENIAEGKALMKKFKSHVRQTYSDIERVEAAELPAQE